MGRIVTPVLVENNDDIVEAAKGNLNPDSIRKLEIAEAVVDTGASTLCLPPSMIQFLGLRPIQTRSARTTNGLRRVTVYSTVRLTIQGRDTDVRVAEVPEGTPVLVGQLPLEDLDLVLFPKEQRLIPNPEHGGEWVLELY